MNTDPLSGRRVNGTALGDFRPLPLASDDQAQAARAEAEALLAQANRMHRQAKEEADRTVTAARTEAQRLRDEARAETERRAKRDDSFDTWAARAVIAGAVGLTASGEYSLARMVGFDGAVAWLLPFVIDVYVIQAFRRHRDIVPAIGLTITANVIYHLADAGLFGLSPAGRPAWWLIALVASVASLILWRMHQMVTPPKASRESRKRRRSESQQAPVESPRESESVPVSLSPPPAPQPSRESAPEPSRESARESESTPAPKPRESKPRHRKTAKRESARKVAPIGDIDRETDALIALMRERGDAEKVGLGDAKRITGKADATAARRLSAARSQYRRETTTDQQTGN
ncbi:hypothetical protein [Streptomyces sp. NBC_01794]|uniref:hypothetical protein n=1 Tax=Streptomyces sp. NBC_01794 TaxID=2975942 RepID=UPI00308D7399|nr:hypothetical protein OIE54_12090 [Streptomyces sp. NBC_01794]